jgi:hypothetical protein
MYNKFKLNYRIFIITLIALTQSAVAQRSLNKTELHGFISQGYMRSTDNNYPLLTKDGSFEFNEAAINISTLVTDKLRIGIQLFARDFGLDGNNDVIIDWAYGDYHWKDFLSMRFGKIKMPLGFYNRGRDVDILRNSILLPSGVYDEGKRDFVLAHEGGSIYGNINFPIAGLVNYELFFGTISVPNPNSDYWRWFLADQSKNITEGLAGGSLTTIRDPQIAGKYILGGEFKWNTPLDGLVLGGSSMTGMFDISAKIDAVVPLADLSLIDQSLAGSALQNSMIFDYNMDVYIREFGMTSFEYSLDKLVFTGEYHIHQYDIKFPDIEYNIKSEGYYAQLVYRLNNWLELGSYYSEYYPDRTDKKGKSLLKKNLPDYLGWQKDFSLTVRFDLTDYWLLKLEGHLIDGCGLVRQYDNTDDLERNWMLFCVKTSFNF